VPFPFAWPFCKRFSASAIEPAECFAFPFVSSGVDKSFFALLEMIKRRRTGAVFGLTLFPPARRPFNAFDGVVVFRFNINYRPEWTALVQRNRGDSALRKAAALECSPNSLACESCKNCANCEHRRLTRVQDSRFCKEFKHNLNLKTGVKTPKSGT
jgi:hypothetical protein